MIKPVQLLDVVALQVDRPGDLLIRGQVGTVVECPAPDVFEVEFADHRGRTYALATFRSNELLVLHYEPARAAS